MVFSPHREHPSRRLGSDRGSRAGGGLTLIGTRVAAAARVADCTGCRTMVALQSRGLVADGHPAIHVLRCHEVLLSHRLLDKDGGSLPGSAVYFFRPPQNSHG